MKRIINGKIYNTETASEIARASNGHNITDFGFVLETLYRTDNGNWFLHGQGGAQSRYAQHAGNTCWGGSAIRTVSHAGALKWCEDNDVDADIVSQHFEIIEG